MTPGIIRRAKRTLFTCATSGIETQGGHLGKPGLVPTDTEWI